jgi:hypothetical protein
VSRPVARFTPSRRYFSLALFALGGALLAASTGLRWPPAWIAAVLFAVSATGLLILAFQPAIEIHETHLSVGRRAIPWSDVRRLDQTGWNAPLAVYLTLVDERRLLLVYPGDFDSATSLLRHLRRYSREALLDGVPYRQFWGEVPTAPKQLAPPRYRLLRPEDEEEVERMFQRLKSVGRLDPRGSDEQ